MEAGYLQKEDALMWADEAKQLGKMLGALIKRHNKRNEMRVTNNRNEKRETSGE